MRRLRNIFVRTQDEISIFSSKLISINILHWYVIMDIQSFGIGNGNGNGLIFSLITHGVFQLLFQNINQYCYTIMHYALC